MLAALYRRYAVHLIDIFTGEIYLSILQRKHSLSSAMDYLQYGLDNHQCVTDEGILHCVLWEITDTYFFFSSIGGTNINIL